MITRLKLYKKLNYNLSLFSNNKYNLTFDKSINNEHYDQLRSKQIIKVIYNVSEYFILRICKLIKLSTTRNATYFFYMFFERRIDNILYKLNIFPTKLSVKQFVSHGNVKINGKRINNLLFINDLDQITIKLINLSFLPLWLLKINKNNFIFRAYNYNISIININIYDIISYYNRNK